jgi:hypothetical protein
VRVDALANLLLTPPGDHRINQPIAAAICSLPFIVIRSTKDFIWGD